MFGAYPAALTNSCLENSETTIRRSSRANKGQHSRFQREEELAAAPVRVRKLTSKKAAPKKANNASPSNTTEEDDDVVTCKCGTYTPEDTRMMLQCDKCLAWQHVACVLGKEDESLVPDYYTCVDCSAKAAGPKEVTHTPASFGKPANEPVPAPAPPLPQLAVEAPITDHKTTSQSSPKQVGPPVGTKGQNGIHKPPHVKKQRPVSILIQ